MKILITNDDGVNSPVLPEFVRWARQHGEVTVVAPKKEQSGRSHAIDFKNPIEIKSFNIAPDIKAYSVDSTPADCVRFAILGLKEKYDIVLSGINYGHNLGDDIPYSGTVGAVFEAGRLGMKGIAISGDTDYAEDSINHLNDIFEYIKQNRLLDRCELYNINIPADVCGTHITQQGGIFYTDDFVNCGEDMYIQVGSPLEREFIDLSIDIDAVQNGYISITPLTKSRTDIEVFKQLNGI